MGNNKLKLGVMASLEGGVKEELGRVKELGFSACQVVCWAPELYTEKRAELLKKTAKEFGIEITTLWAGWPGPKVWDLKEGPVTLGLVPVTYRSQRIRALKKACEFAVQADIPGITTHVGFLPENAADPCYPELLAVLRDVIGFCAQREREFWFETGQETPVTLLRTIEDIGLDNAGINLDPANLLMYGRANPVDAVLVFGEYVCGVHAKDGVYPPSGDRLGAEKPLGEGLVDFPRLVSRLKEYGYTGALTIEREISGPKQTEDIKKAKKLLLPLL